jgi:thiol-disulfide isomerase/thioredoxin
VLGAAACDGREEPTAADATGVSPFAGCAALTAPPGGAGDASAAGPAGADPNTGLTPLPAVELACFSDGTRVRLDRLRGPAVVNLWASWCTPCRKELPVLQRFADARPGTVHVVGVVTDDSRPRAAALAGDLGLRIPTLFDSGGRLKRAIERINLPITLFVDSAGRIRLIYTAEALDGDALAALAERHLGVRPE